MQLRQLRVRNIRSYESAQIAFPPGTTLISGDVGAGKTSLLYAVEMALFGVAEVDAAFLVRHGAPHAEVEVEFEDSDHRYSVRRRFRRVRRKGKETFEPEKIGFTVDGEQTSYSATELRQRVIELLGFPDNPSPQAHSDLWRWAVYVPQEKMRDILAARAQDRLETVRKALGVERYRTAAENAQELAADLKRSSAGRRAEAERLQHYDREHADWTAEADRLHLERGRLADAISERDASVGSARSRRAEADAAVRQAESVQGVLDSLRREHQTDVRTLEGATRERAERLAEIERRRSEAEAARNDSEDLLSRENARLEAEATRNEERSQLDAHAARLRELTAARTEAVGATRRLSELRAVGERAARELSDVQHQLDLVRAEGPGREPLAPTATTLAALDASLVAARDAERATVRDLTKAQSAFSELDELLAAGVCPRCHQAVHSDEFQPHRAEAQAASRAAEDAHRAAVTERTRLEEERRARERYERAHERWAELEKRRALTESALDRATAAAESAVDSVRQSEESRAQADRRLRALEPAEVEGVRLRESVARSERRLAVLTEEVDRSRRAAELVRTATAARESMTSEVQRRDKDLDLLRRRIEDRQGRMDELIFTLKGADERARALVEAEGQLAQAESALAQEREVAVRVEARLDEATRRIQESERGRNERTALLREADDLTTKAAWVTGPFRTAVLGMEQLLLAHAQQAFERDLARYFASLVDDPALVATTDVAFTPAVTIEGEWTPAEALSGGERTSLALAFRLALATVVRAMGSLRLETMLLDEPTDGFSPEQVIRMGELLEELALPQVIIVSHEGQLAAIADRVVRVEKHDGRSVLFRPEAPLTPVNPPTDARSEEPTPSGRVTRSGRRASP